MDAHCLAEVAELLRRRNAVDAKLAAITERPMTAGHLGEWIAAQVFDIQLQDSASAAAIDGHFRSGPLTSRSLNIKWYLKNEGLLDMTPAEALDYYLVLAGPRSAAVTSRGTVRPWLIQAAYLFDARELLKTQTTRGVKVGNASSVPAALWQEAEIYPRENPRLPLDEEQRGLLRMFAS